MTNCSRRVHDTDLVKGFVRAVLKRWEMWDKQNVCQTTKKEKKTTTITPRFTDTSLERFSYDLDKERANKTETTNERK